MTSSRHDNLLVKRALDQAAVWHRAQRRKYPGADVPYVSHLAGVTIILARHGFDESVIAAGALHDAVEDTQATLEEIEHRFGRRVADLVEMVTEPDKSMPWEQRKQQYLERFASHPWEAQAISLADKIDNLQSIVVCSLEHGDPWAQLKRGKDAQLRRYEALATAIQTRDHPLVGEYLAAVEAVRAV